MTRLSNRPVKRTRRDMGYKLKVNDEIAIKDYYSHKLIYFAFVSKPDKDNTINLATEFIYCRETLTECLWDHFNSDDKFGKLHKFDSKKMRLAVRIIAETEFSLDSERKKFNKGMKRGLSAINLMEAEVGWRLTKMYDVSHERNSRMCIKYLVASNRWMRSAHMVSLFCLIFRICSQMAENSPTKFKDLNSMFTRMARWASQTKSDDGFRYSETCKFWLPLLKNFNKIFRGRNQQNNFATKNFSKDVYDNTFDYYYDEGISKLCVGREEGEENDSGTSDPMLFKRFEQLKENITKSQRRVKAAAN